MSLKPAARGFARTRTWIFDLDNTLYPSECRLLEQVEHRMGAFIAEMLGVALDEAQHLRLTYYRRFGTTLTGLMKVHNIDPAPFLEYVHDLDLNTVLPSRPLRQAIERLDGRRLIFTNGPRRHAERVAEKVGILDLFEDICGIETCAYTPKPEPEAFQRMIRAHAVKPTEAAMFEDMPHNLECAHDLGMTTVLVRSTTAHATEPQAHLAVRAAPEHVHHVTEDLIAFLEAILNRGPPSPSA